MPDAPTSNAFTHYVLENPWPLGAALLLVAAVVMFMGLREGLSGRTRIGLVAGVVGLAVIITGMVVTTAGEQGVRVARVLVDAAVNEDVVGGLALFSDDATMHAGSPQNPGRDRDFIQGAFADLAARHTIEDNRIASLRGATISADEAEVRLSCVTTVERFPYPNSSQWIMRVRRGTDGQWKITRLACVSINDQTPPLDRMW